MDAHGKHEEMVPWRKTYRRASLVALLVMVTAAGAVATVDPNDHHEFRVDVRDFASMTVVDATELDYSGSVTGTMWHITSEELLRSTDLAEAVMTRVETSGCTEVSSLSGHPGPRNTTIAVQFECSTAFLEVGWTTDEPGVDMVIGEPANHLR